MLAPESWYLGLADKYMRAAAEGPHKDFSLPRGLERSKPAETLIERLYREETGNGMPLALKRILLKRRGQ